MIAKSKIIGGNWKDTKLVGYKTLRDIDTFNYYMRLPEDKAATTIGFRCICDWKKWERKD